MPSTSGLSTRRRRKNSRLAAATLAAIAALSALAIPTPMTCAQETYRLPPANIQKILDAAPTPVVSLSPDRTTMLLVARENLPPIADLAQPMLRLAGLRINPNTNGPHGPRRYVGLTLKNIEDGKETPVDVPAGLDIGFPA